MYLLNQNCNEKKLEKMIVESPQVTKKFTLVLNEIYISLK